MHYAFLHYALLRNIRTDTNHNPIPEEGQRISEVARCVALTQIRTFLYAGVVGIQRPRIVNTLRMPLFELSGYVSLILNGQVSSGRDIGPSVGIMIGKRGAGGLKASFPVVGAT